MTWGKAPVEPTKVYRLVFRWRKILPRRGRFRFEFHRSWLQLSSKLSRVPIWIVLLLCLTRWMTVELGFWTNTFHSCLLTLQWNPALWHSTRANPYCLIVRPSRVNRAWCWLETRINEGTRCWSTQLSKTVQLCWVPPIFQSTKVLIMPWSLSLINISSRKPAGNRSSGRSNDNDCTACYENSEVPMWSDVRNLHLRHHYQCGPNTLITIVCKLVIGT